MSTGTTTALDLAGHALAYAAAGWDVFDLAPCSKVPRRSKRDGGNGLLDATTDTGVIAHWWTEQPRCNIGGRVPAGVFVIDVDPYHGGLDRIDELERAHGPLPATLTCMSGRGDGGSHRYFHHPGGDIYGLQLGRGIDLRTHGNYCVLPPSIHPDTGQPYRWANPSDPIVAAPGWLVELLRPPLPNRPASPPPGPCRQSFPGDSVADWYTATRSWAEVLAGWTLVAGDGESDGSAWRHPTATSRISATVRHSVLFVYTPTPGLPVTEARNPHGLTKFRAYAHLEHDGDLSAAARRARDLHRSAR